MGVDINIMEMLLIIVMVARVGSLTTPRKALHFHVRRGIPSRCRSRAFGCHDIWHISC